MVALPLAFCSTSPPPPTTTTTSSLGGELSHYSKIRLSHTHTGMVVITTADYIQIIAACIYAAALFYTIVTFRHTKRLDQITLSDRIFLELRALDRELVKIPPDSKYDHARNQAYSRIFGTLDYLSLLVNQKVINDRRMIEYIKPLIIRYYEETFLTNASVDEKDSQSYQEFKKFYFKLKK